MTDENDELLSLLCNMTYAEVPYWYGATRRPLHLDVVCPRQKRPQPVLVWFCGGAFQQMDHHLWIADLMWYARRGVTVVSVEYRTGVSGRWPAPLEDAWAAIAYLRQNASAFCVDPARIAVMGESAGGYIASALGMGICRPQDVPPVQAAINLYGVTDLQGMLRFEHEHGHSSLADLLGPEADALAKSASPLYQVHPGSAPFLIFHGDADQRVPLAQSQALHDALTKAGVSSKLVVMPDAVHGDTVFYREDAREQILRFLRGQMGE